MGAVGGADVDHIDALILQQFVVICIYLGFRRAVVLGGLFRSFRNNIAEGHHLGLICEFFQGGHMFAVGDAAAADDTDSQLFHSNTSICLQKSF